MFIRNILLKLKKIEKDSKALIKVLIISFILISLLEYLLGTFFFYYLYHPGVVGDMFSIINALFAGLAFIGIIYTVHIQSKELKFQREELELTRKEIAGQREQIEIQNRNLNKQNFESTYFQLVKFHHEYMNNILLPNPNYIPKIQTLFLTEFKNIYEKRVNVKNPDIKTAIKTAFEKYYKMIPSVIDVFFTSIYNILNFVDKSDIEDKFYYTNIFCSQLAEFDKALLFYYVLSISDSFIYRKYYDLIEKYKFFEFIKARDLIDPNHANFYSHLMDRKDLMLLNLKKV